MFQVYSSKKLKNIWLNFFSSFSSAVSSRPSLLYSQLSPCGRHAITARQVLNPHAKITDIWLEQTPAITDLRCYGLTDTSLGPDSTILLF